MTNEIYLTPTGHASDCDWHVDQYPWECTCGFIPRKKVMDNLIAQDADLIDSPLQAAVRELLTDDSMEYLGTFTHNLVQAFDRHGLKVVSTDYLDNLNDTVRGLRQDIKAEQKHTDNALDNMDAAYRKCERLREALGDLIEAVQRRTADLGGYDGRFGLNKSIVKARAALETKHD